ncbi:hypothetical protein Tco_1285884 [Tanacetum coccineum]
MSPKSYQYGRAGKGSLMGGSLAQCSKVPSSPQWLRCNPAGQSATIGHFACDAGYCKQLLVLISDGQWGSYQRNGCLSVELQGYFKRDCLNENKDGEMGMHKVGLMYGMPKSGEMTKNLYANVVKGSFLNNHTHLSYSNLDLMPLEYGSFDGHYLYGLVDVNGENPDWQLSHGLSKLRGIWQKGAGFFSKISQERGGKSKRKKIEEYIVRRFFEVFRGLARFLARPVGIQIDLIQVPLPLVPFLGEPGLICQKRRMGSFRMLHSDYLEAYMWIPAKIRFYKDWGLQTPTEIRQFSSLVGYYEDLSKEFSRLLINKEKCDVAPQSWGLPGGSEALWSTVMRQHKGLGCLLMQREKVIATLPKCTVFTDHKSLQHILDQKELNMRNAVGLDYLSDLRLCIRYHQGKEKVSADALKQVKADIWPSGLLVNRITEWKWDNISMDFITKLTGRPRENVVRKLQGCTEKISGIEWILPQLSVSVMESLHISRDHFKKLGVLAKNSGKIATGGTSQEIEQSSPIPSMY